MLIEQRLEVLSHALGAREAALASLRPLRQQAHHREPGSARSEVNAIAVSIERRLQRRADPTGPFDGAQKLLSLLIDDVYRWRAFLNLLLETRASTIAIDPL